MTSNRATVIKNSIFTLIARGINIVSSFFILIAVARYLSVEKYGEYSYIVAFVSSIMALTYFGIQQVMIREIAKDKMNAHHYLGSAIILRLLLSLLAAIALIVMMQFTKPSTLITFAIAVALISEFCLTLSMLMKAVFQAYEVMIYEPLATIVYCVILSAGITAVIYLDMGLLGLLIAAVIANATQLLLSAYIVISKFVRPSFSVDKEIFMSMLKHSSVIGLGIFFYQNLFRIDVLMLKWFGSAEDVAFFQAPHGLIMQLEVLPAALMSALFPVFARVLHKEPEKVGGLFEKSFRYIFILSFVPAIFISLFSEEVMEIVFGGKYSSSVAALSIISWAFIPLAMDMLFNSILIVMNKQRYNVIYGGVTLVINFVAAYFFLPKYGYIAAAYISLASYIILFLFSLYFVVKSGLPMVLDKILGKVTLAAFVSGAAIFMIKPYSLFGAIGAGLIAYPAVLLVTGVFPVEEILLFKGSIKHFRESRGRV